MQWDVALCSSHRDRQNGRGIFAQEFSSEAQPASWPNSPVASDGLMLGNKGRGWETSCRSSETQLQATLKLAYLPSNHALGKALGFASVFLLQLSLQTETVIQAWRYTKHWSTLIQAWAVWIFTSSVMAKNAITVFIFIWFPCCVPCILCKKDTPSWFQLCSDTRLQSTSLLLCSALFLCPAMKLYYTEPFYLQTLDATLC